MKFFSEYTRQQKEHLMLLIGRLTFIMIDSEYTIEYKRDFFSSRIKLAIMKDGLVGTIDLDLDEFDVARSEDTARLIADQMFNSIKNHKS